MKIVLFFLTICWSYSFFGQNKFFISFGESLKFNQEFNNYRFSISPLLNSLSFEELKDYKFNHPGEFVLYSTKIGQAHSHTKNCNHENDAFQLPDSFIVYVDSFRIQFIDSSLALEKPIYKNQSNLGNSITVEAIIENYCSNPIQMNSHHIQTAGIGTKIIAELDNKMKILVPKKHKLRYLLSGTCSDASYIQFDFLDHIGNVKPVGLTQHIKE